MVLFIADNQILHLHFTQDIDFHRSCQRGNCNMQNLGFSRMFKSRFSTVAVKHLSAIVRKIWTHLMYPHLR